MKTITKEEFEATTTRKHTQISIDLDNLPIGEALTVYKPIWDKLKLKSKFHNYIHNVGKPKKFKIRSLKSGAGWAVVRIK